MPLSKITDAFESMKRGESIRGMVTFYAGSQLSWSSPLFRTGVDDLPQIEAVLDLLHLGGEPAIAADPVLHRVGVIGHQVRGAFGAGDLDAEGEGLVVIGQMEADACLRRHADLVHRHDA